MEDFSTILWILVIAAASLLSQGRKARSGKTSRKPGPATDDTAPHPTPTTRPEWPGIPGFPKIPGFPEGGMHDGETRKAAAESAPEAPARRVVSGPESREKPFSKPKTTERAPGTDQPETRETTVFRQMRPQRGSGGTRVPKGGKSRNSDGFRPYSPPRRRSSDFRRQGARPLQRSCRVRSARTTARASRTGRKRSRRPE